MKIGEESKGQQIYLKSWKLRIPEMLGKFYHKNLTFQTCKAHCFLRYTQAYRVL
jgi:hypothetical protein